MKRKAKESEGEERRKGQFMLEDLVNEEDVITVGWRVTSDPHAAAIIQRVQLLATVKARLRHAKRIQGTWHVEPCGI